MTCFIVTVRIKTRVPIPRLGAKLKFALPKSSNEWRESQ